MTTKRNRERKMLGQKGSMMSMTRMVRHTLLRTLVVLNVL